MFFFYFSQWTIRCEVDSNYYSVSFAWPGYLTVHDSPCQDTSLCMTPRVRIPHCAWLPGPGYLTMHDSPGQDTSLCMTPRARIPHDAWLPGPGYLAVDDSAGTRGVIHSEVSWQRSSSSVLISIKLAQIVLCQWLSQNFFYNFNVIARI